MKKAAVVLFLIALLLTGLNGVAAGMHRLLPSSPACVVGLDKGDQGWEIKFLDQTINLGPKPTAHY